MDDAPDATGVYAPLAAQLRLRGILTRQDGDALAVLAADGEQVDTITCRARTDDAGRLWFFDCEDIPISEADDPVQAAITITANARRSGAHV